MSDLPELHPFIYASTLLLLYAETHYAFKGIYSRLQKDEPEIIADVPSRIEPGQPIPVLILVKDADRYPVRLEEAQITLLSAGSEYRFRFPINADISKNRFWFRVLEIPPPPGVADHCKLDVSIRIAIKGRRRIVRNDNYTISSHAAFDIHIAEEPLPGKTGWHFGEFHCHTSYTDDQVEFGAPLAATRALANSMGLSFFCATDHSYDLDDLQGNYLESDPRLQKWHHFHKEVRRLNSKTADFVIVPGEEVSAGNAENRNVHFLILNHPHFIPGHGDGAEKWLRNSPTLSIAHVLNRLGNGAAAFAAHPGSKPPWLERLLLRRGEWRMKDLQHPDLHGLQIWNGSDGGLEAGRAKWVAQLLRGCRLFIAGGNDAHGNFNRFRQIGLPFWTFRENKTHIFGDVKTGVYLGEKTLSVENLLDAFKAGRMIVTDGPFTTIRARNASGQAIIGEEIRGQRILMTIECLSTAEFGALRQLNVYVGDVTTRLEKIVRQVRAFSSSYLHVENVEIDYSPAPGYLRVELFSGRNGRQYRCFTNPIWVQP